MKYERPMESDVAAKEGSCAELHCLLALLSNICSSCKHRLIVALPWSNRRCTDAIEFRQELVIVILPINDTQSRSSQSAGANRERPIADREVKAHGQVYKPNENDITCFIHQTPTSSTSAIRLPQCPQQLDKCCSVADQLQTSKTPGRVRLVQEGGGSGQD